MARNKLLYLFTLVLSAFFYMAYPFWFSWYMLVLFLLFPIFDLLISLPGMLTKRAVITAPFSVEQNSAEIATVTIRARRALPSGSVKLRLSEETETRQLRRSIRSGSQNGTQIVLEIDTTRCGTSSFTLTRLWASSLMGFFSVPHKLGSSVSVTVLPAPIRPMKMITMPKPATFRPKPGGGFSEEHDIRPYRIGDPMNSVHWKLTAKHDSLMVREALEMPPHSRLVRCVPWNSSAERETILGRLRWISQYLVGRDCPHYVKLEQNGYVTEITSGEELTALLCRAIRGKSMREPAPPALPPRFTWVFKVDADRGDA